MPIALYNNYTATKANPLTLDELVKLHAQGYSVMKTPHIGNQHPSNLLCAALGFHLDMVTFTQGQRDTNFHPHLQIGGNSWQQLYDPAILTPFATLANGQSAEDYHQTSVKKVFKETRITTDVDLLASESQLAETVLRAGTAAVPRLWYRRVDEAGKLVKEDLRRPFATIADDVFRFSNLTSGWVVPNRLSLIYTYIWQALSTGRDTVYALSGPDMVKYIGGLQQNLSAMYDAVRAERPDLPEQLHVYVVPVAQCRLVSHQMHADAVDTVVDRLQWYEKQPPEARRSAIMQIQEIGAQYPEFTKPIQSAQFLSQYDLTGADDLYVPQWLRHTPLPRVTHFMSLLAKGREFALAAQ